MHGKIIYVDNFYEDIEWANENVESGKCEVKKRKTKIMESGNLEILIFGKRTFGSENVLKSKVWSLIG